MDILGLARKTENLGRGKNNCSGGNGGEPVNTITLLQPPRVVYGNGCAANCVELFAQRGAKRVLLVTSKSVRPQIDFLVEALKKSGCEVVESNFVRPEPTLRFFETVL